MASWVYSVRRSVGAVRSRVLANVLPFLPRAIWRLLPGTSASFGPPRRWQTWSSYAREHAVDWTPLFPAKAGHFPPPFWPLDGQSPFPEGRRFNWVEQGVARIRDGRVVSVHGWCVAPKDVFLGEFCLDGNRRTSFVYSLTLQRRPKRLAGVTLNLCSAHGAINFCHWLLDSLSRLELIERAGISFSEIDRILLPRFPGKTAEWVLATLKLPSEKLIHPDQRDQFRCETLLQPSFPGYVASYPSWVPEFYRRHFPAPQIERTRRIYIPRRGMRGLTNADEVEAQLRRAGFETFDPAHQTELHLKLADVSHVVGVHGAGMANLVFCQPGTRVLELLPSDLRNPYYFSLCNSADMPYGVVVGKSTKERRREIDVPTQSPFTVRLDELAAATEVLLSDRVAPRREFVSAS